MSKVIEKGSRQLRAGTPWCQTQAGSQLHRLFSVYEAGCPEPPPLSEAVTEMNWDWVLGIDNPWPVHSPIPHSWSGLWLGLLLKRFTAGRHPININIEKKIV